MDILEDVKRAINALIYPLKMLPFDNDYKRGQIEMAETIKRLIEVMENEEGVKIAESLELKEKNG